MKTIAEADLQPATDPGDGWYIIEAAGEYATRVEDTELVQQLTPEVLAAVAAAGVPAEGLPIDRDHLSLDAENSTEAMGWVRELAMCGGNLAARIEWTSLGLPLIKGRVYKHFSTVYPPPTAEQLAAGVYEPVQLIGLALTNQPNNRAGQPPITNSLGRVGEVRSEEEAGMSPREDFSEGEVPEGTVNKPTETTPTMFSPEILAALGLPEGATDEEVLAAVQALKEQAEVANTAAQNAEAAEAEAVINAAEKENGVELSAEEKEEAKEQIITNRAHGLKYVGLLCRDKRAVTNSATDARRYAGKTPLANRTAPADPEQAIANRAQQLCDEARAAGKPLGYFTAVEKARAELARNK
ncbi:MAG: hypothetical protein IJN29_05895 [Akkermansia sp.]|nr:hypothetical protein [Akkermansia sp.]